MCFKKPRRAPRAISKKGYRNTKAAYAHWYRENPSSGGYYYCHYCGTAITREGYLLEMGIEPVTIDHYIARSNDPSLKYDPKNFVPSCYSCNSEKGSMNGDDYIKLRRERGDYVPTH
jgi:5-methylcytosine-specific restriction endonuclease McrA